MGVQSDTIKVVGKGVVTGWTPEDLQRKYDLENDLIARGFEGLALEREARRLLAERYGVLPNHEAEGYNILVTNGIGIMLDGLFGIAAIATPFAGPNGAGRIGVGDGNTGSGPGVPTVSASNTDLSATTNKQRNQFDIAPSRAANVVTVRATFQTTDANYAWNEWAIFNAASGATSMLNHAGVALGTKTSASAWQLTATLTIT